MDFDGDGCGGPGRSTNASRRAPAAPTARSATATNDSPEHAPALLEAGGHLPLVAGRRHARPSTPIRCDTGYEKQCVADAAEPGRARRCRRSNPAGAYARPAASARVDAYEKYRLRQPHAPARGAGGRQRRHAPRLRRRAAPRRCDAPDVCGVRATRERHRRRSSGPSSRPTCCPRLKDMLTEPPVHGGRLGDGPGRLGGRRRRTGAGTKDHVKQARRVPHRRHLRRALGGHAVHGPRRHRRPTTTRR